ncbi:ankyrin repeat domain-containing protein [Brachybacterium sp. EF45031]|uniref:ankyrin repeat domain-containing protein n=1 Tax=Brachybacterium sillae TaxID=2810536 RepID=UPI00217E3E9E|nr:ankyrin repeat domain-containing protein [Brachybacterium sillae]MCS6712515.1 ankyrin repeat domain-containing protein [Brachybacterium sillae]
MTDDDPALALAQQMMDAARQGATAQLTPVLDQGAPLEMRDSAGNTMLMLAAYHGHAGLVAELARRGADVDALNDRGQSPLAGAVFKGFTDVVETLVAAGADPDAGAPSARDSARFFCREEMLRLLETPGA